MEQLRARLKLYPGMVVIQMLAEPLFVWFMWDISSHGELLLWLSCLYLLHLWELFKWATSRGNLGSVRACTEWSRHFFAFALVISLMWGASTLFFFPGALLPQVLVVCVMLGLAAGTATMSSTHPPSFYAYALGVMLPLSFRVLVEQDETHFALGLMLLLFFAALLASGQYLSKLILLSLQQRFEKTALAEQLAIQKGIAEEARRQTEEMNEVLRNNGVMLESMVQERTAQLLRKTEDVAQIRDVTIVAMGSLAEARDLETGNHIKRTQRYIKALAIQLRNHPRFLPFLSEENIEQLFKLAPLHDIGKIGIPDRILQKPGKLTAEEFEIMKTHPLIGGNAIAAAEAGLTVHNNFLHIAREIATSHHEKWDGSGYPFGLKGDEIPISARLMTLADVYDALISRRVYKGELPHEEAEKIICEGRGTHFDPDITDAFLAIKDEFRQIAEFYQG
ncbi:MAG: HD domain-containing protein [Sideroxydans sp.]|nr:HD domain-containing protein [Sideroxydans sp.]